MSGKIRNTYNRTVVLNKVDNALPENAPMVFFLRVIC